MSSLNYVLYNSPKPLVLLIFLLHLFLKSPVLAAALDNTFNYYYILSLNFLHGTYLLNTYSPPLYIYSILHGYSPYLHSSYPNTSCVCMFLHTPTISIL